MDLVESPTIKVIFNVLKGQIWLYFQLGGNFFKNDSYIFVSFGMKLPKVNVLMKCRNIDLITLIFEGP